ncbi:hypothetical protein HZS_8171 [Henneguya salminicola]|nr:hypothetical protein HZS_8171 [Henneguya salminicola]
METQEPETSLKKLKFSKSSLLRSTILSSLNSDDSEVLTNIINDDLRKSNTSLKKNQPSQSKIQHNYGHEKELTDYKIYNEEVHKNASTNFDITISNIVNWKHKMDTLFEKNNNFLTEFFNLSRNRESCDLYETSLVDKIIFELNQKRQETISMTDQISQCINDFLKQQINPIHRMLFYKLKSYSLVLDSISTFDNMKMEESNMHKNIEIPKPFKIDSEQDNLKLSTRLITDDQGNQRLQVIKTAKDSALMKKWRYLNDINKNNDGFNQIFKENIQHHNIQSSNEQLSISSLKNNPLLTESKFYNNNQTNYNYTPTFSDSSNKYRNQDLLPQNSLFYNTDSSKIINKQTSDKFHMDTCNNIHKIENVSRTCSRFGIIPHDADSAADSTKSSDANSQSSSIIDAVKKFFKG